MTDSHCASSPGSSDNRGTAPSGRRASDHLQTNRLGPQQRVQLTDRQRELLDEPSFMDVTAVIMIFWKFVKRASLNQLSYLTIDS